MGSKKVGLFVFFRTYREIGMVNNGVLVGVNDFCGVVDMDGERGVI